MEMKKSILGTVTAGAMVRGKDWSTGTIAISWWCVWDEVKIMWMPPDIEKVRAVRIHPFQTSPTL